VINLLGHSVNALYSVPTALYCFLRSSLSAQGEPNFRETLEYTISLGGDTDTIASMAAALAGSFYSDKIIPENFVKHCEDSESIIKLADQLYEIASR
jgi:poly(ADP-ribose) glycohydrolase ARH3